MIGIDTNVLVRYIVQDDKAQATAASRLLESCTEAKPAYINLIVLCELSWVLKGAYDYDREMIANIIEQILLTDCFEVQLSESVWRALSCFRDGAADFADCMIGELNHHAEVKTTYTFDRKAARAGYFKLLG